MAIAEIRDQPRDATAGFASPLSQLRKTLYERRNRNEARFRPL
jgi:hypothetical protein